VHPGLWFFHAIEIDGGIWACRHGQAEYDQHASLDEAIEHLTTLAADAGPTQLFAHHLDGRICPVALVDPTRPG
jgi:hypothetical protein